MDQSTTALKEFASRADAADAAARLLADALARDVAEIGRASFFASGGSSPKEMLENLSDYDVDWANIDVGLVDERCVPMGHDASNAGLVKRHLLQNKAAAANFYPMFLEGVTPETLAKAASDSYAQLMPPSALLLGMGSDAHTASWFPGAVNFSEAFEEKNQPVVKIDARGCPVAGEITDRLTLTRTAVAASKCVVLLIFGDDKKRVFLDAMSKSVEDAPILAAIEDLGDRLVTIWAP